MPPPAANQSEVSEAPRSRGNALHWITMCLLFVGGAAFRLAHLVDKPFWFDECFSVEVARIGWGNFFHLLWWREANMSLYYALLRAWLHFGRSEYFIRSLSVLISVAALPAMYWLARLLYGRRVALIATALLTFNAYSVRYAQEARSYSLFLLLAILSSVCLVACLQRGDPRLRAGYVIASALAVYAHFYALLLVAAHWLTLRCFGAARPEKSSGGGLPGFRQAWIAIGLAVLPILVFVAKTGAGPIKWISRPGFAGLFQFFENLAGGRDWTLPIIYFVLCATALAPSGKLLLRKTPRWDTWRCQFLVVWLVLPVALTVLLSFARPVFLARYMIFCLPALLTLAAAGLARLRSPWILAFTLAGVLFLSSQGISFVYGHDFDSERDASDAAVAMILDHTQPGDAILFHIAETRVPYEFFRSLRAGTNTASPDFLSTLGPEIVFPRHGPGLDYRDFTGKPSGELVRSAAQTHPRVWIMLMHNGTLANPDPTTVILTQILGQSFSNMNRWQFPLVEVRLYSK